MESSLNEYHHHDADGSEVISRGSEPLSDDALKTSSDQLVGSPEELLECYINLSISNELSRWLADLGLPFTGTVEHKLARLREHRRGLALAAESVHRQTIFYLNNYSAEVLVEICQELGLNTEGGQSVLFKRVYCEVGLREGWLWPIPPDTQSTLKQIFESVIEGFDLDHWNRLCDLLQEEKNRVSTPLAFGRAFIIILIPQLLREAHAAMLNDELALIRRTS
ncbi:hypothetical protein [Nitrospira sp. Nam74]